MLDETTFNQKGRKEKIHMKQMKFQSSYSSSYLKMIRRVLLMAHCRESVLGSLSVKG